MYIMMNVIYLLAMNTQFIVKFMFRSNVTLLTKINFND